MMQPLWAGRQLTVEPKTARTRIRAGGLYVPTPDLSYLTDPPAVPGRQKALLLGPVYLFNQAAINDTLLHNPFDALPLGGADNWMFDVLNYCNQIVTLTLVGGAQPAPLASVGAATTTVAANSRGPYATNIWQAFLGLQAQYTVAPTSGTLTILGYAQPKSALITEARAERKSIDISRLVGF